MLKLTKKADYGLIALRHLAVARPRASASAKDIADSYGIPLPLLSKVLQKLARGGLLISEQGTNGGYRLAREARDISALEAIRVIDGPIILTKCFTEHAGCDQTALCPVREPLRCRKGLGALRRHPHSARVGFRDKPRFGPRQRPPGPLQAGESFAGAVRRRGGKPEPRSYALSYPRRR